MIGRLFCRLGLHNWQARCLESWPHADGPDGWCTYVTEWLCMRCGKGKS